MIFYLIAIIICICFIEIFLKFKISLVFVNQFNLLKEFIIEKGRKPNSLDELKEFFEMRMGTARDPGMEVVKELVEDDKTRITLAGGSFPDLNEDGEITQADILIGKGVIKRDEKQSGGLAAILGL